jgi:hypothetical protein
VNRDASRSKADSGAAGESPADGISQFIAKIFDQLSVTAWLPATMLVGNSAILIRLHHQGNLDLAEAIRALTESPFGLLIVLFIAVVLATMVSQAFSFEVIRVLEGYWDRPRLAGWLTKIRCNHHHKRLFRLDHRLAKLEAKAIAIARSAKPRSTTPPDPEHVDSAATTDWRTSCPPSWLRRIESVISQLAQYPAPHRILPTRLGNTLRSAEDKLTRPADQDLESMMLRWYDRIPDHLREAHDQFRHRLDMYCTLVFVYILLMLLAVVLLIQGAGGLAAAAVVGSVYGALSWVSYNAAVASARGYGGVLTVISQEMAPDEKTTT